MRRSRFVIGVSVVVVVVVILLVLQLWHIGTFGGSQVTGQPGPY